MVLIITTTVVHLAILGSGALFAKWRLDDQVVENTKEPDEAELFQRKNTKTRRAWRRVERGLRNFRRRRRTRRQFANKKEKDNSNQAAAGEGREVDEIDLDACEEDYNQIVNRRSVEIVERRRQQRGSDSKVKMLILMSDTGGGHRASAQALEAAFEELFPGLIEVTMVDIFTEHSRWPYSQSVPAYQYAAKNPLVWRAMYEYARFPPTRYLNGKMLTLQNFGRLSEAMHTYSPDFVVSVHPLCQDLPLKVLNSMGPDGRRELPFVTVVTDLGGAHPTWFNREVDKVFVASDAVMRVAFREGLAPSQIHKSGLPIRPAFWRDPRPTYELRADLGLEELTLAVMIMGGGDGVGGLGAIATAVIETLAQKLGRSQVVVICGKNHKVKEQLEGVHWPDNVRVIVRGFVSNMDEWMGAVDCLITKAGPGTIAEATIRGLPVMLSGFLPGQEEGNVPYVVNGGFGAYSNDPHQIGATVALWLEDADLLSKMKLAALDAARPRATYDIAIEIGRMMFPNEEEVEHDEVLESEAESFALRHEEAVAEVQGEIGITIVGASADKKQVGQITSNV